MIKEGKFGPNEAICLIVITLSHKLLFSYASSLLDRSASSGWLMNLFSCISAIILFTFVYILLKRFPRKNLIEIFDISLGRAIGLIFSFAFAVAILIYSGIVLRGFTDIAKAFVFPHTPSSIISGSMLLPMMAGAYLGLENIARFAKLTAYFALGGYLLLTVLISPLFNITNIFPIMGYGLDINLLQGVITTGTYIEIIFIALFAGSLQGIKHVKKAGYISLLIAGLINSLSLILPVLVMSYPIAQEQLSPFYILARQISIGDFLQRMDPIFLFLWFITIIIALSIDFYCGISAYSKAFRLQNIRPLIIPAAIIVYVVSSIPKDDTTLNQILVFTRTYGAILAFGLPLVALIVSVLRKKKGANMR